MESIAIVVVITIFVLWFGKKSPETAKQAGNCIKEFKKGLRELPDAVDGLKKEFKEEKK